MPGKPDKNGFSARALPAGVAAYTPEPFATFFASAYFGIEPINIFAANRWSLDFLDETYNNIRDGCIFRSGGRFLSSCALGIQGVPLRYSQLRLEYLFEQQPHFIIELNNLIELPYNFNSDLGGFKL